MPARAWRRTRSAAATCSSSARISGSRAFSRVSQLETATSLSCNNSSASRSGCTLPPCMLENLPGRTLGVSLTGQCFLFKRQSRLLRFGREVDFLLFAVDFAIQQTRLEPIHRALENDVRPLIGHALRLQRLVRARGRLVESIGGIV